MQFNLIPQNHKLNQLHLKTLLFFREEKRISLLNLRSAYNQSLTELSHYFDQVHQEINAAEDTLKLLQYLYKHTNSTCTSMYATNRVHIKNNALLEETQCAVKTRTKMHSTVHSYFYSLHDEALRQSTQSQWLTVATLGRYNALTQQTQIKDELQDIILFSDIMWDGTMDNVRNEVQYVYVEVDKEVLEMKHCSGQAFANFQNAMKWNVCQSLKCTN